jgi:hypothetical protein
MSAWHREPQFSGCAWAAEFAQSAPLGGAHDYDVVRSGIALACAAPDSDALQGWDGNSGALAAVVPPNQVNELTQRHSAGNLRPLRRAKETLREQRLASARGA